MKYCQFKEHFEERLWVTPEDAWTVDVSLYQHPRGEWWNGNPSVSIGDHPDRILAETSIYWKISSTIFLGSYIESVRKGDILSYLMFVEQNFLPYMFNDICQNLSHILSYFAIYEQNLEQQWSYAAAFSRTPDLRPVRASPFLRGNSANSSLWPNINVWTPGRLSQVGRLSCWELKAINNINKLYYTIPIFAMCSDIWRCSWTSKKKSLLFGNFKWITLRGMELLPMPRSRQSLWQFPGNRLPDAAILAGDAEMGIAWSWFNQQKYAC